MASTRSDHPKLYYYWKIARPDNWFKNVFLLPGTVIAWSVLNIRAIDFVKDLFIGLLSACFIASSNYVINEWLDRKYDKFHPVKKNRPSVSGMITFHGVFIEYVLLVLMGLVLAYTVNNSFFIVSTIFMIMGVIYNVEPFRTKDKQYLDVLSESINNPIRLLLGWFIVTSKILPPISLLIAYWMGGAYLMAVKRYSEYKFINDKLMAEQYRRSFKYYSEENLILSSLFYAVTAAFFSGIFLIKYKLELLFVLPLYSVLFTWYFHIGQKPNSAAQHPEKMHQERYFVCYAIFVGIVTMLLFYINIHWMEWFLNNSFINISGN
jgi:4-hydroxybenzoate polyprenyltransferase